MKTKHLRLMQRAYVILFFCFMYLPIAYMIVFSFNQSKGYALFTGFTLKWYTSLLWQPFPRWMPQPWYQPVWPSRLPYDR